MGKKFGGKTSASPNFTPRDGLPAHKVYRVSISPQKSTLRIKVQCWFFSYGVHECLSLRNIKKLVKFILVLTYKLLCAKKPVLAHFRRRLVEATRTTFADLKNQI
jgi:hypothetical protein